MQKILGCHDNERLFHTPIRLPAQDMEVLCRSSDLSSTPFARGKSSLHLIWHSFIWSPNDGIYADICARLMVTFMLTHMLKSMHV